MYSMNYIGKFIANFREFYNEINGATLTGAIDVVVVEQPDGTYTSSPFHVRFGKLGVLRSRFKVVDLELNGEPLNIHMKLGESGEAFFVEEIPEDELEASAHLATSPIPESRFDQMFGGQDPSELTPRRRNSVTEYPNEAVYENQISDFSKRRYTDGLNCKPELVIPKREYQMYKEEKEKFNDYTPSPSTLEQEPMFPMEGLDDAPATWDGREPVASTPETNAITPKTFKAADLSENESVLKEVVRKISINNDFRPISMGNDQTDTKDTQSNIDDHLAEDQKQQNNGKKKKKTKKSGSKKKHQRKSSSSSNASTVSEQVTLEAPADKYASTPGTSGTAGIEEPNNEQGKHPSDLHFFSDPEIDVSKLSQESEARVCSPVQSDSELEIRRCAGVGAAGTGAVSGQSWRWGELPEPLPRSTIASTAADALSSDEENAVNADTSKHDKSSSRSAGVLSGMFSFMKHKGESESVLAVAGTGAIAASEGVYLADLADGGVDPEVAALYFPPPHHTARDRKTGGSGLTVNVNATLTTEEDYESGNGPSLPQSPSSMDGPMLKGIDSDDEELKMFNKGYVGVSLCGLIVLEQPPALAAETFEQSALCWEEFCRAPDELITDAKLVVRVGERYLPWTLAAPLLLAIMAYHRPLPRCGALCRVGESGAEHASCKQQQQQPSAPTPAYSSWWSWRKSADKQGVTQTRNGTVHVTEEAKEMVVTEVITHMTESELEPGLALGSHSPTANHTQGHLVTPLEDTKEITAQEATEETVCECPAMDIPVAVAAGVGGGEGYSGSQSSEESDEGALRHTPAPKHPSTDRFRKSLRLTSQQIASLNLKEGMNEVVFSVTTAYQGTTRCKCNLFRWRYDDKIVISDIDGTITKSDVLGHIFPLVGKDWAQSGVAQLFTKIKNNGYKLLYLSARAIGQAKVTREYLRSIKQGDLSLPDGPLLLNPTSLLRALHREVIEKKPEEFKIQCLSDIRALFPADANPFYAGYGNRTNDVCAYQAVGIPIVRIFTINYKGELKHELTQTFQSTYVVQSGMANDLFPPVQPLLCS